MTQQEIDNKRRELQVQRSTLERQISEIDNEFYNLRQLEVELDDPHALIPNSYNIIEEWLEGHPHPNSVLSMIAKNKAEAESWKISCNTYNFDYHIVKCKHKEEYERV